MNASEFNLNKWQVANTEMIGNQNHICEGIKGEEVICRGLWPRVSFKIL